MRVLYICPLKYGENPSIDAMTHAIDHTLAEAGLELRVGYADFRDDDWLQRTNTLIEEAVAAGVRAIVFYSIDVDEPAEAVAEARRQGVSVVAVERPRFPVDASLVYPNFNHGVYMAEYLASLLPAGAKVGIDGGPGTADDTELVLGFVHGLQVYGLDLVNDPMDERYRNTLDVRSGGYEKTKNLLADFSHLDGLIPYNDETALGAIDALRETGRLGEVKTVSRNGAPNAVRLVAEGVHHGTWDLHALGIGKQVGDLVVRLVLNEEKLDGLCVASAIGHMITPELARSWVPWDKRIPFHPLREW